MSTSNLLNNSFDDSDEEDDNFNPQPADLSDNEDEGHHTGSAQRNEASRHQVGDDDGSEDESAPASGRKHSSGGGADDGEDEDEDEEGDGEDIAADDDEEDEEEEEDDDEEEITVRISKLNTQFPPRCSLTMDRLEFPLIAKHRDTAVSVAETVAMFSSMLKQKSMKMKMKTRTTRMN